MGTILDEIVEQKETEVKDKRRAVPLKSLRSRAESRSAGNLFQEAIEGDKIDLIAEIKPCSPSAGRITELDASEIATVYSRSRPAALSILTDKQFFGQGLEVLKELRKRVSKPILRKDFIIDEYQIYETAAAGADCLLLIAAVLSPKQLRDYYQLAAELGLDVLLEIHDPAELEKLTFVPRILGINNRRLSGDFSTDLKQTAQLLKLRPQKSLLVSESGIKSADDIRYLQNLGGVNAVLVGTALLDSASQAAEIERRIESLMAPVISDE